jgi:hypothetical protein
MLITPLKTDPKTPIRLPYFKYLLKHVYPQGIIHVIHWRIYQLYSCNTDKHSYLRPSVHAMTLGLSVCSEPRWFLSGLIYVVYTFSVIVLCVMYSVLFAVFVAVCWLLPPRCCCFQRHIV